MWFLPLHACGLWPADSEPAPKIPVAVPEPPPPPAPPGPLPKLAAGDAVVVEFASDEVGGAVALACGTGAAAGACEATGKDGVWAVAVSPLKDPDTDREVVVRARRARTVPEKGPQCTWLRVEPADDPARSASAPRVVHAVGDLPAPLAASPPHRAWAVDLDGDGAEEVLYEKTEHGATNTIGVVLADGKDAVVWQDEPATGGGGGGEDEEGGGSPAATGGTWSSVVGLTDATLDGRLEIVLDLDRHDSFGFAVFAWTPEGGQKIGEARCAPN